MKLAFISLMILIVVLCGYFFLPQKAPETSLEPVVQPEVSSDTASQTQRQNSAEENLRLQKEETYEKLEKARRNLDRVVARIKALAWNKDLPKEMAKKINAELLNAHGLLKNKRLLGAFTSLEAIQDELNKVSYSHEKITGFVNYIKGLNKDD